MSIDVLIVEACAEAELNKIAHRPKMADQDRVA